MGVTTAVCGHPSCFGERTGKRGYGGSLPATQPTENALCFRGTCPTDRLRVSVRVLKSWAGARARRMAPHTTAQLGRVLTWDTALHHQRPRQGATRRKNPPSAKLCAKKWWQRVAARVGRGSGGGGAGAPPPHGHTAGTGRSAQALAGHRARHVGAHAQESRRHATVPTPIELNTCDRRRSKDARGRAAATQATRAPVGVSHPPWGQPGKPQL